MPIIPSITQFVQARQKHGKAVVDVIIEAALPGLCCSCLCPYGTPVLSNGGAGHAQHPGGNVTAGTVVGLVWDHVSEEIVKTCVTTENDVALTVYDGDIVRIVDNFKTFADVLASFWGADAVSFGVSRTLFNGVSAAEFVPNSAKTRVMIVTGLACMGGKVRHNWANTR